jgi:adenylosuccinate synthase
MTNIKVVIGANFGDEGKGLMTDYFCHQSTSQGKNCIVVMSNGGAQRGHTVTTPNGEKFIFKHFSSGTLVGASTYCMEDYILNPMSFVKEYNELWSIGYKPFMYIHPNCRWTTPYDMFINQIVEEVRDNKKHGSCGMGIWETVYRYAKKPCVFTLSEFANLSYDAQVLYLESIRDSYMIGRLKEYGITSIPCEWREVVYSKILIDNFIADVKYMCLHTATAPYSFLKKFHNVVFENGQGLLLDQNMTFYGDNTTPSNTGITNPLKVINGVFDKANLEVCYVSRTYMTRHGVGRFETECNKSDLNPMMIDESNPTNEFQGNLRYGELIPEQLLNRVHNDINKGDLKKFNSTTSIAITHTNEKQFDYSVLQRGFINNIYLSDRRDRESVTIFK